MRNPEVPTEATPEPGGAAGKGSTVRRRTVVAGAVWATPIIVAAAAAPAMAVSPSCDGVCPPAAMTAFSTAAGNNGWAVTFTSMTPNLGNQLLTFKTIDSTFVFPYSGPNCPFGSKTGLLWCDPVTTVPNGTTAFVMQADPVLPGAYANVAKSFCLKAGVTYTFTYSYAAYGHNAVSATMTSQVTRATTGVTTPLLGITSSLVNTGWGGATTTFTVPAGATDIYSFAFRFTFSGIGGANDFVVSAPTITCSPAP